MAKGYKGFDENLCCNPCGKPHPYEVGKTYEEPKAKLCKKGLHYCENPLDVLAYYPPATSRYCEVEADGDIDGPNGDDTKACSTRLTITAEIGLLGLIKAGVEYIKSRVNWDTAAATKTGNYSAATNTGNRSAATNTGDWSAATNTGDQSAATNTGYQSAATNTGNRSAATVSGQESVAISLGIDARAKGALGCWIVLAEWRRENEEWHRIAVKSHKVDGRVILPDTYYKLRDGKFVASEENPA